MDVKAHMTVTHEPETNQIAILIDDQAILLTPKNAMNMIKELTHAIYMSGVQYGANNDHEEA